MLWSKQHSVFSTMTILVISSLLFTSMAHPEDLTTPTARFGQRSVCGYPVLAPEVTGGPYPWNTTLIRRNVTETQLGVPLSLTIQIVDINTCSNLSNAAVEIWSANYLGSYSHYDGNSNSTFLRGILSTDTSGAVTFDTLYPGSYTGRTVHIHLRVHYEGYLYLNNTYTGGRIVHTGQLFFDDSLSDQVLAVYPYSTSSATRTYNSADNIYSDNGQYMIPSITLVNSADVSQGLVGSIVLVVNSSATADDTNVSGSNGNTGGGPGGNNNSTMGTRPSGARASGSGGVVVGTVSASNSPSQAMNSNVNTVSSSASNSAALSSSVSSANSNELDTASSSGKRFTTWMSYFV